MHVQIKHSLAHLQDLIPTLAGDMMYVLYHPKKGLNLVDVLENALFVHAFDYIIMFELNVTG